MRKNNVRKTKTDKIDTFVIAKTLMMQDSLRFLTLTNLDYIELKELGRFCPKTVNQRTRQKIQLTSYIEQVFWELQYFFKSVAHQHSVGIGDSPLSIQITQTIEQIELLDRQLFHTEL